ncbi:hypothetical protein [Streptomyces sp. NPDC017991]|uniref:hypothetical protein n=1 Tax=Streptomyces sp. NPDC017991 TaxID=3365026 RepID=UPI00378F89C3
MTSESAATLRSRFVEQTASDLEENRRRQQELVKRVEVLKQEEALLGDLLELVQRYKGFADASHVPGRAQEELAVAVAEQLSAEEVARRPALRKASSANRSKIGTKGKPRQPLLGDVLVDLLGKHDEPRPAKEVRKELLEKHPSRCPTPQVVRNVLESLVAKGRIERHKQQRSVMYALVEPAGPESVAASVSIG